METVAGEQQEDGDSRAWLKKEERFNVLRNLMCESSPKRSKGYPHECKEGRKTEGRRINLTVGSIRHRDSCEGKAAAAAKEEEGGEFK